MAKNFKQLRDEILKDPERAKRLRAQEKIARDYHARYQELLAELRRAK